MIVDVNTMREIITVLCFIAFLGIVVWAYSARSKDSFASAAMLPFDDDPLDAGRGEQNKTLSGAGK